MRSTLLSLLALCFAFATGCTDQPIDITKPIDAAGEKSALLSLRTLHAAQLQHLAMEGRYASSLNELALAGAVQDPLATGEKTGYLFAITAGDARVFTMTAVPKVYGTTGKRRFYADHTGTIRYTDDAQTPLGPQLPALP